MLRSATLFVLSGRLAVLLLLSLAVWAGCRREEPESYIRITRSDGTPVSPAAPAEETAGEQSAEERLGLAFYPGAEVVQDQILVGPSGELAGVELTTAEPYAEVVKFYRERYRGQSPRIKTLQQPQRQTTLGWQDRQANFTILIKQDPARHCTVISLAAGRHTGRHEPATGVKVPALPPATTGQTEKGDQGYAHQ
jgi:hypothetical protein